MIGGLQAFRRNPRDKAIAALAIPALGTLAIDPLVSIVDTAWVGRLGTVSLAALAVASAVFGAVFAVFNFVHITITPLVAGEIARDARRRAGGITKGALVISFVIGIGLAFVVGALAVPIVGAFGASGGVLDQSAAYLQVRVVSLPAMFIVMVGHGVYRGHHDTRTPLYVSIGMNLINLVVDPLLIFGAGMGVVGAAWATVLAQSIAAAAFLVLMFGKDRIKFGLDGTVGRLRGLGIGRILSEGWPMMMRSLSLLVALTATTFAATRIGTIEVAAHQIALQTWLFMSFVLDSLAVAAMALIGSDFGSGDRIAAREVANRLLALGLVMGILLGVGLAVIEPFLAGIFAAEPAVASDLETIIWFIIVLQPLTALVYVWDGIGVGASAFRFMAVAMVAATAVTVVSLMMFGDTLVGVWVSVAVLVLSRLVAFAGWHRWGPFSHARDPSPGSQGVA
ncbi:MAG: MATE family efflux transporter [Acidimicrobiia bacterium]|nr:MAG: MATE family efflux transporter [Acidimicrobiia bacterium]